MPRCVDCKFAGEYFDFDMGISMLVNLQMMGWEDLLKRYGITNKDDLQKKAMNCQAPGGGPTPDPIVLFQALADQPCDFFAPKQ